MANEYLDDGSVDFSRGQDAWHHPSKIQEGYYAAGVNVSTKGGFLSPRLGYTQLALQFDGSTITTRTVIERSVEDIWKAGKAQAFIGYEHDSNSYMLTVVSGLIYRTNIDTNKTVLLSKDIKVNQYADRIFHNTADNKVFIFDYPAYPVIIDGDSIYRSVYGLIPPAVMGCFNNNREFVSNNGIEFTAGDPTGSTSAFVLPPGYPLPISTFVPPVSFAEYLTPSSPFYSQSFALPTDTVQPITAMGNIPELDSSTGIGPLFVATENNVCFYKTNQPRDQWQSGQFGGVLLYNVGIAGNRAVANCNSDLIFVTPKYRVHALSTARNDTKRWGNVPISREVQNYLEGNDPRYAQFSVVAYHDNRVFITAKPYAVLAQDRDRQPVLDYASAGMVVLELGNISSFLTDSNPAWCGLWTGINPVDIITVKGRCFVLAKDGVGEHATNAIYELESESTIDTIQGNLRRVRSRVYTKEFDAQQPYIYKHEHSLTLQIQEIAGDFSVDVARRPSHSMGFEHYGLWEHSAPVSTTELPTDDQLPGFAHHNYRQIYLGDPVLTGSSPLNQDSYATFYASQLRIELEGDYWQLEAIRLRTKPELVADVMEPGNTTAPITVLKEYESSDWDIPEVKLCKTE